MFGNFQLQNQPWSNMHSMVDFDTMPLFLKSSEQGMFMICCESTGHTWQGHIFVQNGIMTQPEGGTPPQPGWSSVE